MFAGEWNVLSRPNNKVVGPNGVLEGTAGDAGIISPTALDGLALWLDAIDQNSLLASDGSVIEDGEAVALWSDKSGNSVANAYVSGTAAGNYLSASNKSVTGNQTFTLDIALSDYTPASDVTVVNKLSGNDGFKILVLTTGVVRLQIGDGASVTDVDSSAAFTMTDLARYTVRIDWEDGVGATFAQDGVAVGSPVSAVKTLTNAAVDCVVGTVAGVIYRAQVGSVYDCNPALANKLATSFSSGGDTWAITTAGATGARISGARDLYQGTVANRPVFLKHNGENYGYLNGATGNYFSTPDSAALDITGNLDIIVRLSPLVWNGGVTSRPLVTKWNASTNNKSYGFQLANNGQLQLIYSINGTTTLSSNSVAHGIPNGQEYDVRVVRISSTGLISFYKKLPEDTSWTLVSQSMGTSGALYSGASQLAIVNYGDVSSTNAITGNLYRVWIWNGLSDSGGTLAFDFNPQSYVSGSTFLDSAGGATITLNDGAHIVTRTGLYFDGSNDYLKSASFSLSQPESVYFIGEQVSWTALDKLCDGNSSTERMAIGQAAPNPSLGLFAGGASGDENEADGFTLKTSAIATGIFNDTSSSLRINRNAANTTGSPGTNNGNGFTLGARYDGTTAFSNIFVHEILIYDQVADSTDKQNLVALYAGKKWKFAV